MQGSQLKSPTNLQSSKIVSISNDGSLNVDPGSLHKILDSVRIEDYRPTEETPVNIIVITGPDKERILLANLLIESLTNFSNNGVEYVGQSATTDGRTNRRDSGHHSFQRHHAIYMCSQLFRVKNEEGQEFVVGIIEVPWIDDVDEFFSELKEFLGLVCSKMLTLEWTGTDKVQLKVLDFLSPASWKKLVLHKPVRLEEICYTSTHEVRCTSVHSLQISSDRRRTKRTNNAPLIKLIQNIIWGVERKMVLKNSEEHALTFGNMLELITVAASDAKNRHKERDKAGTEMERIARKAAIEIMTAFSCTVKYWINNELSVTTTSSPSIGGKYIQFRVMDKILEQWSKSVHKSQVKEFTNRLVGYYNSNCQPIWTNFQQFVITLNTKLQEQFGTHDYVSSKEMKKILHDGYHDSDAPNDAILAEFKKLAGEKLVDLYTKKNEKLLEALKEWCVNETAKLGQIVKEEVEQYLNQDSGDFQSLQVLLPSLLTKMHEGIKNGFQSQTTHHPELSGLQNEATNYHQLQEPSRIAEEALQNVKYSVALILQLGKVLTSNAHFNKSIDKLLSFYNEEMNAYLTAPSRDTNNLHDFHSLLSEQLVRVYVDALNSSNFNLETVVLQQEILEEQLNQAFNELQAEAKRIIQKLKAQYHEKVKEMLQKYPGGLDEKTLCKLHAIISYDVIKLLEVMIRSKVAPGQQREEQKQILQSYMDNNWKIIAKLNADNINLAKLDCRSKSAKGVGDRLFGNGETTKENNSFHPNAGRHQPVPPLVFHLQGSRVVMGAAVESQNEILKNEFGETQTSALIIVKPDKTFVYGPEALRIVQSSSDLEGCFCWRLADFFRAFPSWGINICFERIKYSIATEFMLGFLLRKMKQSAERKLSRQCDTAALAIPFWLTSTQRIKVKDAAEIAGFSKVYLVNEASAAAYMIVENARQIQRGEMLVVTENFDRVNAFVYSYCSNEKKITMLSHALSDNSNPTKGNILHTCKLVLDQSRVNPDNTLLISENASKWGPSLTAAAVKLGRRVDIGDSTVINGLMVLSKNPEKIGELIRDKLAFEIFRHSAAGGREVVSKEYLLPVTLKKQTTEMLSTHQETKFYQHVLGNQHLIGDLWVKGMRYNETLKANFDLTSESTFTLDSVTVSSTYSCNNIRFPNQQVEWTTPNMNRSQIKEQSDLMNFIVEPLPSLHPHLPERTGLSDAKKEASAKVQRNCK